MREIVVLESVLQIPPSSIVATGDKIYFDYNGLGTTFDNVPADTERGLGLLREIITPATEEEPAETISVFVRLRSGDVETRGLTAYDQDGQVLWRIGQEFRKPDTINYNRTTQRIALTYTNLPSPGIGPGIKYYRLDGSLASITDLGNDFSGQEVSRKGKLYCFETPPEGFHETIVGFSPTGASLWSIAGESVEEGWFWGGITAYGEDYIIVDIVRNRDDPPPGSFNSRHGGYRIYNAHTGTLVSERMLSDNFTTVVVTSHPLNQQTSDQNQSSYGEFTFVRSAYWP